MRVREANDAGAVDAEPERLPAIRAGLPDHRVVELEPWLPREVVPDKTPMATAH